MEVRRPGSEETEEDGQVQGLRRGGEDQGLDKERPPVDQGQVLGACTWVLVRSRLAYKTGNVSASLLLWYGVHVHGL